MDRKLKLVELILIESESLKTAVDPRAAMILADQLIQDAEELAKLIQIENKKAA